MDEFGWRIRGTLVIWRNFLTWMIWINVSVMITETVGFINLARVGDEYLRFHVVSYVFICFDVSQVKVSLLNQVDNTKLEG